MDNKAKDTRELSTDEMNKISGGTQNDVPVPEEGSDSNITFASNGGKKKKKSF